MNFNLVNCYYKDFMLIFGLKFLNKSCIQDKVLCCASHNAYITPLLQ